MSEWKKVKLDELYEVHNGLSKGRQFFGTGFPFLTFSNVFNNWFLKWFWSHFESRIA